MTKKSAAPKTKVCPVFRAGHRMQSIRLTGKSDSCWVECDCGHEEQVAAWWPRDADALTGDRPIGWDPAQLPFIVEAAERFLLASGWGWQHTYVLSCLQCIQDGHDTKKAMREQHYAEESLRLMVQLCIDLKFITTAEPFRMTDLGRAAYLNARNMFDTKRQRSRKRGPQAA